MTSLFPFWSFHSSLGAEALRRGRDSEICQLLALKLVGEPLGRLEHEHNPEM